MADYHDIHYERASDFAGGISGKRVLVVGANTGQDCRAFIERGASEVHGVDPIAEVGADFQHPRVVYHKASIEAAELPQLYFDLVYSVATMEHVADLEGAFKVIGSSTRYGGAIYALAAPLWNSRYGHHMGCFDGHPWVHLLFDAAELVRYAKDQGITGERGYTIEALSITCSIGDFSTCSRHRRTRGPLRASRTPSSSEAMILFSTSARSSTASWVNERWRRVSRRKNCWRPILSSRR